MNKKLLIAMSGGVDSSVASLLASNDGFECSGATMRLYDDMASVSNDELLSLDTPAHDALKVCQRLGIDFHLLDCRADFESKVINEFISAYERGDTPNPCVICNKQIKFGIFMDRAKEKGFDRIATGHYAICEKSGDRYLLKKGADASKDQSYFLYSLNQSQLSRTVFPLGGLTKDKIREIALENGFENASKKDSQDICFVPDGDYVSVIKKFTNKEYPKGNFVNTNGDIIGTHLGFINYTVGQRKGLGTGFGERVYVCSKNAATNEVVLGKNEDLFSSSLDACDFNWIATDVPTSSIRASAKVRYSAKEASVTVHPLSETKVHIEFDTPQRAIAKGQAVVLYDGDCVVGGGTIER